MTAVQTATVTSRLCRQSTERKYWMQEASELLILKGVFDSHWRLEAAEYAESLTYRNLDENGELMVSPSEAVEDDLIYPDTTMS